MSEFLGNDQNFDKIKNDHAVKSNPGKVATDVKDVFADGEKLGLPVFDITKDDFFRNMKVDRKKLRFQTDHPVSQYMRKTRYSRPFWIRDNDSGYVRKVK